MSLEPAACSLRYYAAKVLVCLSPALGKDASVHQGAKNLSIAKLNP